MRSRLVVLASGNGSNLQAIIDACADGRLPADIVAVISDRAHATALERADTAGAPAVHIGVRPGEARADYDARLADVVAGFDPHWVVLAGWMRVLSMSFLGWFPGMVVNLHPAMPGQLPGTHAIDRAFAEARRGSRTSSGVMVHLVPDEGVDDGPALATAVVPILPDDTLETFEHRVHLTEHQLLVDTLRSLCERPLARTAPTLQTTAATPAPLPPGVLE
jgi:formyltetrahydrofolate-dependent phosphoribosylglycinamide formyltransferase